MDCINCGAPMQQVAGQSYFACDYCSSIRLPKGTDEGIQITNEAGSLNCPLCSRALADGRTDDEPVSFCPDCRGMLIAQRSFSLITRKRRARYAGERLPQKTIHPDAKRRHLQCPGCQQKMESFPYHGPGAVIIDNCGACWLIWLDHGELSLLERA